MNHENLKTTPDRVATKAFRTPVNQKSPIWSPIFHATTPDLNASASVCKGTPALIESLGINQELDVSWSATMETPPNANMSIPGIIKLDVNKMLENEAKPCHLFHNKEKISCAEDDVNNSTKLTERTHISGRIPNLESKKINADLKAESLLSLLKKPASRFIYPEPIYINIVGNPQMTNPIKSLKQQQSGTTVAKELAPSALVEQKLQKNVKEVRKSLDFSHDSLIKSHKDISYHTSHYSNLQHKEATEPRKLSISNSEVSAQCLLEPSNTLSENNLHGPFHMETDDVETLTQPKINVETIHALPSCIQQQYCGNITPRIISESVEFSTAKGQKGTVFEKAIGQSRRKLEEFNREYRISLPNPSIKTNFNGLSNGKEVPEQARNCGKVLLENNHNNSKTAGFYAAKAKDGVTSGEANVSTLDNFANETPSSSATEYPELIGFSTAGGKKLTISETAMEQARAKLEEIANGDFNFTVNHNKREDYQKLNDSFGVGVSKKAWKCDETLLCSSNEATIPLTMGFSTANGKTIAVSEEAMNRGRSMFSEVSEATPPYAPTPKTAGFSTAGGKKIAVSEKAIAQSRSFFSEFQDCDIEPIDVPLASFSMASGKKIMVSEEAIARGQALLDDVYGTNATEENTIESQAELRPVSEVNEKPTIAYKQTSATSAGFKMRSRTSFKPPKKLIPAPKLTSPLFENHQFSPLQVPLTVGFNTASGKDVKIAEASLCRARKIFEENLLMEGINNSIEEGEHTQKLNPNARSPGLSVRNENIDTKTIVEDDNDNNYWVSSPTIGKKTKRSKKRNNITQSPQKQLSPTPISGTPSAFESCAVSAKIRALRRIARQEQMSLIQCKQSKSVKSSLKAGYLYRLKKNGIVPKKTWRELIGNCSLPEMLPPYKLLEDHGVLTSVCLVRASNASAFNFCAWDHFPIDDCLENSEGMQIGEFLVIFSDENTIGCEEIEASFLASENVDPTLISCEWIRNHYRWIVWKLASMELRMPSLFARKALTLSNVLEQLKYRYDKEIDHCQRSALRRIIEQDDTAAKTMILCVAEIQSSTVLELTDGWYSIEAHCDSAMQQLIEKNKIFVGVKLVISGAELVSPGPSAPLEKGSDTYLKISANSTRRARWDSKLGFYSKPLPFPIALASILPDGGVISHIQVHIIRVYPVTYMEKAPDGKTIFRGERQYRRITESAAVRYERMMEKVVEDIEREEDEQERKRLRGDGDRRNKKGINLTDEEKRSRILVEAQKRMQMNMKSIEGVPMLKVRVVDVRVTSSNSAIVSIWRPTEDLQHYLREGRVYRLYNVNAAGLRFGELQLNATKNTSWSEMKQTSATPLLQSLARSVTPFSAANQFGFKPMFNELDIVGLVVYVGQQQSKGPFQTAILSDGTTYFGVKCWGSLEDYALADVIVVGSFLAFSNLQWRATACRTASKLQFAFIHEGTLVSSRPALKHLDAALQDLKQSVKDPSGCVTEAEGQVDVLLGNATPQQATPKYGNEVSGRRGMFTPTGVVCSTNGKKSETPTSTNHTINRARLLEKYPEPPALSPWNGCASPLVRQKFKPPARKPSAT
ncbi:uncharacterized protein LOC130701035 [Daphnia carinata]|uniref:uncharacterized protein LOC130701035 n=1 Tax=Daphnia carinata TaxID=120202 RepID=UPI00257A9536|nr:uncharacterized protein LOC130701035 [Daphnia carinata]